MEETILNILTEKQEQLAKAIADKIVEKMGVKRVYKVWLSYDLGLDDKADGLTVKQYRQAYRQRYQPFMDWLDDHGALECGKSVAIFDAKAIDAPNLINDMIAELNQIGISGQGVRIYVVISEFVQLRDDNGKTFGKEMIDFYSEIILRA